MGMGLGPMGMVPGDAGRALVEAALNFDVDAPNAGDRVEVYSNSHGVWFPARVVSCESGIVPSVG